MTQPLPLTVQEVVCLYDVDRFARECRSDLEALVQDVLHILLEEFGSNLDVPDRGIGIMSLLSGSVANLRAVSQRIDQQLPRDSRIDTSSTDTTQDPDGTYRIRIQIGVKGAVIGLALATTAAHALELINWTVTPT